MGSWTRQLVALLAVTTAACGGAGAKAHHATTTSRPTHALATGALRVIDPATGIVISTTSLKIPLVDRVAVGTDTVVVGGVIKASQSGTFGAPCERGRTVVLGVRNGRIVWSVQGSTLIDAAGSWVLTSRVRADGHLYTDVRAVADGRVQWTSKGREGQATTLVGNTVLFDGNIVTGGHPSTVTGVVTAHDAASGQVLWRASNLPAATLAADGNRVYVLAGHQFGDAATSALVALDVHTGNVVWSVLDQTLTPFLHHTSVDVNGDTVIEELGGNADTNRGAVALAGIAADSGRVLWKRAVPSPGLVVTGDATVHTVYGFSNGGPVYVIDPVSGALRNRTVHTDSSVEDLVGADHGLLVLAGQSSLTVVRARDGRVVWRRSRTVALAPLLAAGRLYLGESALACFNSR